MTSHNKDFQPRPGDLFVIPETLEVPQNFPFATYKMRYLFTPSVIRTGATDMTTLSQSRVSNFFNNLMGSAILLHPGAIFPMGSMDEDFTDPTDTCESGTILDA